MIDAQARATQYLKAAGFQPVDVPVLLPIEDFVRISGEEFRRRIFVTTDSKGRDWCLRPEFTIPVASRQLAVAPDGGRYSYAGRVFRNGGGEAENWQVGAEFISAHDPVATDAEALTLALGLCADLGLTDAQVSIGDVGLFTALLDALAVPAAWKRRLTTLFGDSDRVVETLAHMADGPTGYSNFAAHGDIVARLSEFPSDKVGQLFADILAIDGVQTVGGRSTAEIAERVLEQAMLAGDIIPPAHVTAITDFLAINASLSDATAALDQLSARIGKPERFESAIASFAARAARFDAKLAVGSRFSARFGRRLGYYDGFVFDIADQSRPGLGPVAGGGRYDGLMASFGAKPGIRAIGFAVSTDLLRGGKP